MSNNNLFLQSVGKRIYECRKNLGLTQEEFAKNCNASVKFISYVENGKRTLKLEQLLNISHILNVSVNYLLTGEIIDEKSLLKYDTLSQLTTSQFHVIEMIIGVFMDSNSNL